jgi:hypothetical protein
MKEGMPGTSPEPPRRPEDASPEELTLKVSVVDLGRVVATPGALRALEEAGVSPQDLLRRHVTGDWGELDEEDWAANNRALIEGARLLSAYPLPNTSERVWIITEWDRTVTTLLLPAEY